MTKETKTELSLFVRDQNSGRIVYNSKAIVALGIDPLNLAVRGYPVDQDFLNHEYSHGVTIFDSITKLVTA